MKNQIKAYVTYKSKIRMKTINQYIVTYGCVSSCSENECIWTDTITVSARNKREARKDVESELRERVKILSIVEI